MFWVVASLMLATFSTIAFVGMADARRRFRRFEQEVETAFPAVNRRLSTESLLPRDLTPEQIDARKATGFTSSLLSAMQAHSQGPHHLPETVPEETSVPVE